MPDRDAMTPPPPDAEDQAPGLPEGLPRTLAAFFPRETGRSVHYRKRRFIFHQGDPVRAVYYLTSGMVALHRVDDEGRMTIFRVVKPGSLFAWPDLLGSGIYRNSAETLVPSAVAAIPAETFTAVMQRDGRLAALLFQQAAAQVDEYEEQILRLSTLEVPERLFSTLCALAGNAGAGGTVEFSVPLLKRDLAALIGTSPEGISRGIRRLEQMDVAEFDGRKVRLRTGPAAPGEDAGDLTGEEGSGPRSRVRR